MVDAAELCSLDHHGFENWLTESPGEMYVHKRAKYSFTRRDLGSSALPGRLAVNAAVVSGGTVCSDR